MGIRSRHSQKVNHISSQYDSAEATASSAGVVTKENQPKFSVFQLVIIGLVFVGSDRRVLNGVVDGGDASAKGRGVGQGLCAMEATKAGRETTEGENDIPPIATNSEAHHLVISIKKFLYYAYIRTISITLL